MKSEGIDVTQQPAHVLRRVKRELKQPPPPRRQQRQKPIGFMSKKQLCTYITLFSTFLWRPLHDYDYI